MSAAGKPGLRASKSDGSLLALVDVSIDPPTHTPQTGEVWRLDQHVLAVVDVMTGWPVWAPYLRGDAVFCPYPGPYVPLSLTGEAQPLVLVQPDPYLAGLLLDKYAAVHGQADVRLARDPDQL